MYHFDDARAKTIVTAIRPAPASQVVRAIRLGYHGVMPAIPVGARRSHHQVVTPELAIDFLGPDSARVLSTPSLIGLFEMTCRNLLKEFLPAGEDSVGVWIEVRHMAPTPLGMRVTVEVEVTSLEGRRVNFSLRATDEQETVAEGSHQRYLVNVQRFSERVRQKAAGSAAPPG